MSWPALRTVAGRVPTWRQFALASLITLIAPVVVGASLSILFAPAHGTDAAIGFGGALFIAGFYLAFSFYLSWLGLLVALPLSIMAMRRGFAGWAVALLAGLAVGGLIGAGLGLAPWLTAPAGLIHGGTYWLALRLLAPAVFDTRAQA